MQRYQNRHGERRSCAAARSGPRARSRDRRRLPGAGPPRGRHVPAVGPDLPCLRHGRIAWSRCRFAGRHTGAVAPTASGRHRSRPRVPGASGHGVAWPISVGARRDDPGAPAGQPASAKRPATRSPRCLPVRGGSRRLGPLLAIGTILRLRCAPLRRLRSQRVPLSPGPAGPSF